MALFISEKQVIIVSSDSDSEKDGNTTKWTKFIPPNRRHARGFRYHLPPLDLTQTIDITSVNESGKKLTHAKKSNCAIKKNYKLCTKFQILYVKAHV